MIHKTSALMPCRGGRAILGTRPVPGINLSQHRTLMYFLHHRRRHGRHANVPPTPPPASAEADWLSQAFWQTPVHKPRERQHVSHTPHFHPWAGWGMNLIKDAKLRMVDMHLNSLQALKTQDREGYGHAFTKRYEESLRHMRHRYQVEREEQEAKTSWAGLQEQYSKARLARKAEIDKTLADARERRRRLVEKLSSDFIGQTILKNGFTTKKPLQSKEGTSLGSMPIASTLRPDAYMNITKLTEEPTNAARSTQQSLDDGESSSVAAASTYSYPDTGKAEGQSSAANFDDTELDLITLRRVKKKPVLSAQPEASKVEEATNTASLTSFPSGSSYGESWGFDWSIPHLMSPFTIRSRMVIDRQRKERQEFFKEEMAKFKPPTVDGGATAFAKIENSEDADKTLAELRVRGVLPSEMEDDQSNHYKALQAIRDATIREEYEKAVSEFNNRHITTPQPVVDEVNTKGNQDSEKGPVRKWIDLFINPMESYKPAASQESLDAFKRSLHDLREKGNEKFAELQRRFASSPVVPSGVAANESVAMPQATALEKQILEEPAQPEKASPVEAIASEIYEAPQTMANLAEIQQKAIERLIVPTLQGLAADPKHVQAKPKIEELLNSIEDGEMTLPTLEAAIYQLRAELAKAEAEATASELVIEGISVDKPSERSSNSAMNAEQVLAASAPQPEPIEIKAGAFDNIITPEPIFAPVDAGTIHTPMTPDSINAEDITTPVAPTPVVAEAISIPEVAAPLEAQTTQVRSQGPSPATELASLLFSDKRRGLLPDEEALSQEALAYLQEAKTKQEASTGEAEKSKKSGSKTRTVLVAGVATVAGIYTVGVGRKLMNPSSGEASTLSGLSTTPTLVVATETRF